MQRRWIGDRQVGAVGFGAAELTFVAAHDEKAAVATVHAALDAGVTLLDTALAYSTPDVMGHNEQLIGRAIRSSAAGAQALVATKGGHHRDGADFPVDGRPETIRRHCELSLRSLGVERIGLYQLHHPDPDVPLSETLGAFAALLDEGKIAAVGLSNVTRSQLDEALAVVPVTSVQNRFSPIDARDGAMIQLCAKLGIAYLAYSPLGGPQPVAERERRLPAFRRVAERRGVSTAQVVLAWILAQAPVVIPIPGSTRPASVRDGAAAADLALSPQEMQDLG